MSELKKAPLYVKTTDDLPGNFHEVKIFIGFSTPVATSFTFGLVDEIEYEDDSVGKFILSYTINGEEYFISLNPENKACLTQSGGIGPIHKAFLLMESMDTAIALTKVTPKPNGNVTSFTVYKLVESENGDLIFQAVYKNDYIGSYS